MTNTLCGFLQEMDGLAVGRRSVEMETHTLTERLEASKRVMDAARRESNCLEKQVKELERKLQASQEDTQAAEEKLLTFLRKVSGVLQVTSENVILPTEKDIIQKLDKVSDQTSNLQETQYKHVSAFYTFSIINISNQYYIFKKRFCNWSPGLYRP